MVRVIVKDGLGELCNLEFPDLDSANLFAEDYDANAAGLFTKIEIIQDGEVAKVYN